MPVHKRNRMVYAAAGFGVFQRLVQVGCTLLLMPRLLDVLGAANFGVWGAVTSLAWITGLVDIGTGSALVSMVAHSIAANDIEEARSRITKGLTIGTGLAGVILVLAFVAWIGGALRGEAGPYLIAIVALTINIPLHSSNNVWMGLQKGHVSGFWDLVQTLLTTAALFAAFGLTNDVRVYVALVYGCLIAANLGSLIHLFVAHPELRPRELPPSLASLREVGESGMLFFVLGITGGLSFMLDNVLALQLLGPEASAQMTIAMRICMSAVGMLAVLTQPLWPAFADAAHKADRPWIRRSLFRGTALLVGATAAGSAILVLFGESLLRLWLHGGLGIGLPLLWALSAWVVSQALIRVSTLLLNGLLLVRFQIGVASVATLVSLALKFLLAPYLGVGGILWATTIPVVLIVFPASAWRIYRWARQSAVQEGSSGREFGAAEIARNRY